MMNTYEADFFAWTQAQAAALRATRPNNIDWANIAEELEAMGRSERREAENRIRLTLTHLLKWRYQSWMRTPGWRHTLRVQRRDLEKVLRESPSLRSVDPRHSPRRVRGGTPRRILRNRPQAGRASRKLPVLA